jgi:predicted nucleic acid-binding protein
VILVDTSVWIDHLRNGDLVLQRLLEGGAQVEMHPFVLGEIALGNLAQRDLILGSLSDLPMIATATDQEVLAFIEAERLHGLGVGFVDAHLLASVRLTGDVIWTRDKRLRSVADSLSLASALD